MAAPIKRLHVAHVNLSRGFRGGERQTQLLVEELATLGLVQTLVLRGGEPLALHAWPPDVQVVSAATPLGGHLRVGRRPHLIHAHEAKAGYFGLLHHMLFRSPYVLTRQVPFPVRDRYWSQRVYAKASRVVAISPHVRDRVAASLRAPAAIDVIANAVSYRPSNGLLRAELNANHGRGLRCAVIGELVDENKGQSIAIDAFARLDHPAFRLFIVGRGRDEAKLKAHACSDPRVHFVGFQKDVNAWLDAIDVLVFTSFYEGFGSIVLDAMAAARVVVASDISGYAGLVRHNDNCLLFPPGDVGALTHNLRRVESDAGMRERLAQRAVVDAQAYSARAMAERYMNLYRELTI